VSGLTDRQRHRLGVICGVAAGAWLGAAEAPMKLVSSGISPFVISLGMVVGVFMARWTLPALLKGTDYIRADFKEKPHLVAWALLAGMLWAVANALTVFAIRDVGLAVAFPLWNLNSLVGLFWGWLLFGELRGGRGATARVVGGVVILMTGACLLAWAPTGLGGGAAAARPWQGIAAALGAGALWGSMYIPYRKAYISGMNPMSFVAVFTLGELVTALGLAVAFEGGFGPVIDQLTTARPVLFWLFAGGFCWVIGDLFQQYAAKYVGIARGIPLSNTNQLWGLAWGMLVFGELRGQGTTTQMFVIAGSILMALGALTIGLAAAPEAELESWNAASERECRRYGLDRARVLAALKGEDPNKHAGQVRRWWEWAVAGAAIAIAGWLLSGVGSSGLEMNMFWLALLTIASLVILVIGSLALWRGTRFS
jgi:drug/metabolite transporter (DMT)-like permease